MNSIWIPLFYSNALEGIMIRAVYNSWSTILDMYPHTLQSILDTYPHTLQSILDTDHHTNYAIFSVNILK